MSDVNADVFVYSMKFCRDFWLLVTLSHEFASMNVIFDS